MINEDTLKDIMISEFLYALVLNKNIFIILLYINKKKINILMIGIKGIYIKSMLIAQILTFIKKI